VIVVGAGLAGLTAADVLSEAGADVLVIEARERVGGRVKGIPAGDGRCVDAGAAYLGDRHTELRGLLARFRLGTTSDDMIGDSVFLLPERHRSPSRLPPLDQAALGDLFEALHELARDVDPEHPVCSPNGAELDALTAGEWLRRHVDHPDALAFFPLYLGQLIAADPADVSALCLGFYLKSGGGLRYLNAFRGGAQQWRVEGGVNRLAGALADALPRSPVLGRPVRRISRAGRVLSVATDHETYRAGVVIVAVPPALVDDLMPDSAPETPLGSAAGVPGSALKVHLIYDEPVWRRHGLSGWSLNAAGPLTYTVDSSPADSRHGVLTGFITGASARRFAGLTAPAQRTAVGEQLSVLFPGLPTPEAYHVTDWNNARYSRGCYAALQGPGYWSRVRGPVPPARRDVIRCGSETSAEFYGFMEGAIRSGRRAAAAALAALRPGTATEPTEVRDQ
jgi:monoamine oxidase